MRSPAVYVMIMMKIKEVTLCALKASSPKVIYFERQWLRHSLFLRGTQEESRKLHIPEIRVLR